jgi:putative serine protease PepD
LPNGPSANAGLKPGDIITKFDSREITAADELIVAIRAKSVGDKVQLTYLRAGKSYQVILTLSVSK